MSLTITEQLAGIVIVSMAAQWVAWRLRLPSILLLLSVGLLLGPGLGILQPDHLFGELLLPVVSLAVAVILFEGGLSLEFRELKKRGIGRALFQVIVFGGLITGGLSAWAAHVLLGLAWPVAILLGTILVVTGPTVIGPMLRYLHLGGRVGALLRWEGMLLDLVGALASVMVLTMLHEIELRVGLMSAGKVLLLATVSGTICGGLAAVVLIWALRRLWLPDSLQVPVTLMLMFGAYTLANAVEHEAGLVAVTVMGMVLANQTWVSVRHLVEFKETLTTLLISVLFVTLSARLQPAALLELGWSSAAFAGWMIVIVRPVSIWVATLGTSLSWQDRVFLAWMAPRGIVAASIASLMALALMDRGYAQGAALAPLTFLMAFVSVSVYGLSAGPLARWLGLVHPNPQGIVFIGAHRWARRLGQTLQRLGCPVMFIDSDWHNIRACRMEQLPAVYGNAWAEQTLDSIDFSSMGRLLAVTSNDELNTLACIHFREYFGRKEVYQLVFTTDKGDRFESALREHHGRFLFGSVWTYSRLYRLLDPDPKIRTTQLTPEFDEQAFRAQHQHQALILFVYHAEGQLKVNTMDDPLEPSVGDLVVWVEAQTVAQEAESAPMHERAS
ncbi:MAG: sodium/hydrogen antiporter [Planctomycetaceae bacterium]|nr:MAG: sodium/hydrogen antiporter [Planctomycetaceae bacterium]